MASSIREAQQQTLHLQQQRTAGVAAAVPRVAAMQQQHKRVVVRSDRVRMMSRSVLLLQQRWLLRQPPMLPLLRPASLV
jgi:hypothetical protein